MSKSLSDLRANPPADRPQRSITLCLKASIVAKVQALTNEMNDLPDLPAKARKGGQAKQVEHPRSVEIRAELQPLLAEMAEHEGQMTVRATPTDGEWRQWADANPPRDKETEPVAFARDQRITTGLVNSDALIADLAKYAWAWNGDLLGPGEWAAIFEGSVAAGDKAEMAGMVAMMYEGRMDFRSWRSGLSGILLAFDDSASPETSESPRSDSTAGNPEPSSEDSTETATQ